MRVRDSFAYPFKVLGDVFTDLRSVPEPEFTRFDLNALRVEDSETEHGSEPRPVRVRKKIRIPVWLLVLVGIVIALIIVG
jgi:hypothetical protein